MTFADFGEVIHSIPAPGHYSNGLAWDGSSLWVANIADANHPNNYWYRIFQISPENGDILTSFSTGSYFYHGLAYDGNYIWGEHNYTSIEKLSSSGESLEEISAVPLAVGLAFNQNDNILFQSTTQPGAIYKFDIGTGEIIGELYPDEPYEHGWCDLAFDGTYLWHINTASDMIYKIDQYTGEILDEFSAPSNQCEGLTFDGLYLWVSDTSLDILYQIDIEFECVDGEINNDNPCNPMECWDGQWYEIIIDCPEWFGVPCEDGLYVPPTEGECCSECVLLGDINNDSIVNVLDAIEVVDMVLNGEYNPIVDMNDDQVINILDIIDIIYIILN